jgi:hypothetical protein
MADLKAILVCAGAMRGLCKSKKAALAVPVPAIAPYRNEMHPAKCKDYLLGVASLEPSTYRELLQISAVELSKWRIGVPPGWVEMGIQIKHLPDSRVQRCKSRLVAQRPGT